MLELIPHLLEHAFEDTIYLVPFLLVTYFLLEALEHKAGNRTEELVQKAGRLGPWNFWNTGQNKKQQIFYAKTEFLAPYAAV